MRALDRALAMLALGRDGKFLSFQNDELDALSPLAAENGSKDNAIEVLEEKLEEAKQERNKMRVIVEAARKLTFGAYPAHGSGFVLIVTGGNVDDLAAALSSPAPKGVTGGDEFVP